MTVQPQVHRLTREEAPSLDLVILPSRDNYFYLLVTPGGTVVVDPAVASVAERYLADHDLKLTHILNTHHHQDHVGGNLELQKSYGAKVVGPADVFIPGLEQSVGEGDALEVGGYQLVVLETPGHGDRDISYVLDDVRLEQPVLFCGDTLFCGGCGRLMDCGPETMFDSLERIAGLADETLILCGHEYTLDNLAFAQTVEPGNRALAERVEMEKKCLAEGLPTVPSDLGLEKATNPFLRTDSPEIRNTLGLEQAEGWEVFAALRARKDVF